MKLTAHLLVRLRNIFNQKLSYDVHILRVRLRVLTQELVLRLTRSTQERTVHTIDDGYEKGS